MEIVVEETLTLEQLREVILEKYGSREALETAARKASAAEAQDDLVELESIEAKPPRDLARTVKVTTYAKLRKGDIRKLTPARLDLLERVNRQAGPMRVMELAKKARRNAKNVSEDIEILAELGLLRQRKVGREKLIRSKGKDIHIRLLPR